MVVKVSHSTRTAICRPGTRLDLNLKFLFFVSFSATLLLGRVWAVVTSGKNPGEIHRLTPRHWHHSHMSQTEFKPRQRWGTASSQWLRLRPHGHQGRPLRKRPRICSGPLGAGKPSTYPHYPFAFSSSNAPNLNNIGKEVREVQHSENVLALRWPMMLFISRLEYSNLLRVVDQILTFASCLIA